MMTARLPSTRLRPLHKLASAIALTTLPLGALAAPEQPHDWNNVRIDGGGFVPAIIFNESEPNLIYARTDIGGAYRWHEGNQEWQPLLDWVGWDRWGWNGVMSLATDPVDPDRVYAALGMYTNDWDPNNGAIARSSDRGETWQVTELPYKVGGNMPGRGMGERLRVDPNDNSILYYGAEGGNGLWRSTDYGVSWSKVDNFTAVGTYAADPDDPWGYGNQLQGVVWVTFDKSSGSPGQGSDVIYVGVADLGDSLFRSTDGGQTWETIPGAPTGLIPHKGKFDHENGLLYVAMSDTGGPYDGETGAVWKYDSNTGIWTDISPLGGTDLYFGYSGLTLDRQNPGTLMVASLNSWWPDMIIFRSTDFGASWTRIWDWAGYPARSKRYEMDISSVPWLTFGMNPNPPEEVPKLGWMNESVEIDPHNSDRFMYGTGATIYGSNALTLWDQDQVFTIEPMIKGLEETAVLDLASPPSGDAHIFSALGDIGGFKHTDLTSVPDLMYTTPSFTSTTGIDFAALDPSIMVRVGNTDGTKIGVSTSSGNSWWAGQEPSGVTGGGKVAISADGGRIVWSPAGTGVHLSTTLGSSWTAVSSLPAGAVVESDRVNPQTFYGFSGGVFYVSQDGGATFSPSPASGLPTSAKVTVTPGIEGDIWLAGGTIEEPPTGLWHSVDGGQSFTRIASVEAGVNIGLGAAAPNASYQTLYLVGTVDGVTGVFRSTDVGVSWVRINDDQHQYGNMGEAITGDPRIYGRVYLGTNGRGLLYADPAGDLPDNEDPVAEFTASPLSGDAPLEVSFDASMSSDPDGDPLTFSWSFGDGGAATGPLVTHTYQNAGAFTATLNVSDGQGGSDTASTSIQVNGDDNTAPISAFSASPDSGEAPLNVQFDGSDSYDPDGDALTYTWNFGDGNSASGMLSSHTYTESGTYLATLTVSDGSLSHSSSTSITVDTLTPPNTPPVAHASATPQSGESPLQVQFDGSGSSDEDGDPLSFSWDFGDGNSSTDASPSHTYGSAGSYTATLTVSDGQDSDSQSLPIEVTGNTGGGSCEYVLGSEWGAGFVASIRITNNGNTPINGWTVSWQYTGSSRADHVWNANVSGSNPYSAGPVGWNNVIQPGGYVEFGFQGSKSGSESAEIPAVTGGVCD